MSKAATKNTFCLTFPARSVDDEAYQKAVDAYDAGDSDLLPDEDSFEALLSDEDLATLDGVTLGEDGYDFLQEFYENFDFCGAPPHPTMERPKLRCGDGGLVLAIAFAMDSEPREEHVGDAAMACKLQFESDKWYLCAGFDLPKALSHLRIEFDSRALETPEQDTSSLDAIVASWTLGEEGRFDIMKAHVKLDGMDLEEVIDLYKTLRSIGIRPTCDGGENAEAESLWAAVSSQLMRRFEVGSNKRIDEKLRERE